MLLSVWAAHWMTFSSIIIFIHKCRQENIWLFTFSLGQTLIRQHDVARVPFTCPHFLQIDMKCSLTHSRWNKNKRDGRVFQCYRTLPRDANISRRFLILTASDDTKTLKLKPSIIIYLLLLMMWKIITDHEFISRLPERFSKVKWSSQTPIHTD